MRFLDIAVAVLVGTASFTALSVWNPAAGDMTARQSQTKAALTGELLGFVQAKGIPWFLETPAAAICAVLTAAPSSGTVFAADIGPTQCGPAEPAGRPAATLSFRLSDEEVILEAWSGAGA